MYITRSNEQIMLESFATPFITAILGPRRIGKSTLVEHYASQHPDYKWVFLNMDKMAEKQRIEKGELSSLIEEYAGQLIGKQPKLWISIDEAQKCPEIFDQIKVLYDHYKNQDVIKFILTGSGFLSLHQFSAESLAGRIQLRYLREFNLQESYQLMTQTSLPTLSILDALCEKKDFSLAQTYINELRPFKPQLEKCLNDQLIFGGLPEVLQMTNKKDQLNYLSDYLQTYLEKDVRAIDKIADLHIYQNLIKIISEQTGSVRNDTQILQSLGSNRNTLKKYRWYLMATLFYQDIYPYISSSLKKLVKSPKGYLVNNGIISYLTGLDELAILEKSGAIGHRLENWFLKELNVWLDRNFHHSETYFWRTSAGAEVDFIVEIKPEIFPFEITYSKQIQRKKINNLLRFLKDESNAKIGFYVYSGDYHFDQKLNICFLPLWAIG